MNQLARLATLILWILFTNAQAQAQNTEWGVAFNGGSVRADVRDMAIDPWNNTYVVGRMSSGNVGGNTATMRGLDIFLAKIDPSGTVQWVANAGGGDPAGANEGDSGWAVKYDSIGNSIYIVGERMYVSPNPFNTEVTVTLPEETSGTVEVVYLLGKLLRSWKAVPGSSTLDLSFLNNGAYQLVWRTRDSTQYTTLIKCN